MRFDLQHAGYIAISTTQAGNAELWAACLDKSRDEGVSFLMTPERAKKLHEELGEWLKERGTYGGRKGSLR